jgi:hypothetical protein
MAIPEWMRPMLDVVDDKLMRQIAEDFRRGPPPPGPTLPKATPIDAGRVVTGTDGAAHTPHRGWSEAPKLPQDPPGWSGVEALLDAEDRAWREQRQREFKLARLRAEVETKEIKELEEKLNPAPKVQE